MSIQTFLSHARQHANQAFCTAMLAMVAAAWLAAPAMGQEKESRQQLQPPVPSEPHRDPPNPQAQFEPPLLQPTPQAAGQNDLQQKQSDLAEIVQQQKIELLRLRKALEQLVAEHQQIESEKLVNLPPLEDGTIQAFNLKNIDPGVLAETLEMLLGPNQVRLVPDAEHSTLLAYANKESMRQIQEMIVQLDATFKSSESASGEAEPEEPRSLMVRIFWLADGLPEWEGISTGNLLDYLPGSVLEAVERLGLEGPRLVSQSTASVVIGEEEEGSEFHFKFPAIAIGAPLQFQSHGEMMLEERPRMNLHVEISGEMGSFELGGRLSAPLGHYMVLGTANYVQRNHAQDQLTTSRFAFVVQVVEAESFAPE